MLYAWQGGDLDPLPLFGEPLIKRPVDRDPAFSPDGSSVWFVRQQGQRTRVMRTSLLHGEFDRPVAMDEAWGASSLRSPLPTKDGRRLLLVRPGTGDDTDSVLLASTARELPPWFTELSRDPPVRILAGDDPRLPAMPEKPTLVDYFTYRFGPSQHLLQSARLARQNGCDEKIVLACLLHDISVFGLLVPEHGYWGAQLVAPYVDEEVTWAIKHHQALRFRPDPEFGYEYPELYTRVFGEEYRPPEYIRQEWDYCREHRWYGSAMHVVTNDLYAFDPGKVVRLEEFEDVIGRHFRQPAAGLGFDGSPVAHMWRTLIWPNNFL